jgi:hypothetical protein
MLTRSRRKAMESPGSGYFEFLLATQVSRQTTELRDPETERSVPPYGSTLAPKLGRQLSPFHGWKADGLVRAEPEVNPVTFLRSICGWQAIPSSGEAH